MKSYYLLLVILILAGCSPAIVTPKHHLVCEEVYDLGSERCLSYAEAATRLGRYRVIFMGDHHHSKALHVKQSKLLEALSEQGYGIHLANEWFTPYDNEVLKRYDGTLHDLNWSVGYPFESFKPLYDVALQSGGRLYGINLSKTERKAISDANRSAMRSELLHFYEQLDLNVSAHRELLAPFFSHCHGSVKDEKQCQERLYRVQSAWDAKMGLESAKLAKKLEKDAKARLVVFAGAFHLAYGLGINMRFSRLDDALHVTLLPHEKKALPIDIGYADMILFYEEDTNSSKTF